MKMFQLNSTGIFFLRIDPGLMCPKFKIYLYLKIMLKFFQILVFRTIFVDFQKNPSEVGPEVVQVGPRVVQVGPEVVQPELKHG